MIKSTFDKTKAKVEFKTGTYNKKKINKIWCLPFRNELLVKISTGTTNYFLLHTRNRFSKRLLDLSKNTNKVLLLRQIKRLEARVLHIFKNSNNNNMRLMHASNVPLSKMNQKRMSGDLEGKFITYTTIRCIFFLL